MGEGETSRVILKEPIPRGVQTSDSEVGVEASWSLEGEGLRGSGVLVGDSVGVVGRIVAEGDDGDSGRRNCVAGDSGRRKGEVRGEPNERGEGLYVDAVACASHERNYGLRD